ncbi:helix-turn-helix transcriptional regulator [Porphyromonas sp.]|uniref:helix-turn-helix transcriptional regulator n=1 Tax=Porphyromonas sp. TaxID=1924944 RepID=UPI0026DB806D|nr:helix-turn-helix transcriptional regulator [Porphyromonas sp.]MDO4695850.1 helix-turn-helix transcriptional regulator [Porphyromonas sp.]MDO4771441.1 helix-turn-helix transcriptional regulator [Porphyromonas sp.]
MKTEYQNVVIDRIRKLRLERNISQQQLALLLGISNGQIGNIESYKTIHKYTLNHIYKICCEFGVPIEEIFYGKREGEATSNLRLIEHIVRYENNMITENRKATANAIAE